MSAAAMFMRQYVEIFRTQRNEEQFSGLPYF